MEAKVKKIELSHVAFFTVNSKELKLDFRYKSSADYLSNTPSLLFIHYDEELTEELIKSVIESYSGNFFVFHIFKTDKLYLSNVTSYMKELFNIESEEVSNE